MALLISKSGPEIDELKHQPQQGIVAVCCGSRRVVRSSNMEGIGHLEV